MNKVEYNIYRLFEPVHDTVYIFRERIIFIAKKLKIFFMRKIATSETLKIRFLRSKLRMLHVRYWWDDCFTDAFDMTATSLKPRLHYFELLRSLLFSMHVVVGATEITGADNSARSKLQGWKTRELTTWHEMTGVDNAGV